MTLFNDLTDKALHRIGGVLAIVTAIAAVAGLSRSDVRRALATELPVWLMLVSLLAIAVAVAAYVRQQRRRTAALTAVQTVPSLTWHEPDDMTAFQSALAAGTDRVVLIGISLAGLFNPNEQKLRSFLAANARARMQVYVLNPDCDNLVERAAHEAIGGDVGPDVMANDIRSYGTRLRALDPRKVTLKTYDWYPTWRMQMVDQDVIFAASYPPDARGLSQKVLEVRKHEHPELFEVLHNVVKSYERETHHVADWASPQT